MLRLNLLLLLLWLLLLLLLMMHLIVLRIEAHAAGIVSLHHLSLLHGLLLLLLHPARFETQIVGMTVFILIPLIPLLLMMLLVRPVGTIGIPIARVGIVCWKAMHLVQTRIVPVPKAKSHKLDYCDL